MTDASTMAKLVERTVRAERDYDEKCRRRNWWLFWLAVLIPAVFFGYLFISRSGT